MWQSRQQLEMMKEGEEDKGIRKMINYCAATDGI